jgi:2-methylcitrate dehydratase PrpD
VIQAIQELKQQHGIDPQAISRIVIRGDEHIMDERHAVRDPDTIMGGQYSLPFTVAVALTRDLSNPLQYDDAAVRDPVVRDLAQRIELIPSEAEAHAVPGVYAAEVSVECQGRTYALATRPHKGSPRNPFTWEEICQKFRRFTAPLISATQADGIIEAIGQLEQIKDMAEVARLAAP